MSGTPQCTWGTHSDNNYVSHFTIACYMFCMFPLWGLYLICLYELYLVTGVTYLVPPNGQVILYHSLCHCVVLHYWHPMWGWWQFHIHYVSQWCGPGPWGVTFLAPNVGLVAISYPLCFTMVWPRSLGCYIYTIYTCHSHNFVTAEQKTIRFPSFYLRSLKGN